MRRTEQIPGPGLMKVEEIYGRTYRGEPSQLEASEIWPGVICGETWTRIALERVSESHLALPHWALPGPM